MGALFLISDEPAEWLTPQQRYRLKRYILGADAQSLVSRVRDRARTLDLFAAPPALDAVRENIHISGACEQHAEQFMLIPQKILDGYTSETTFRQLLRHHPLMEDHSTTTLRLHLTDCLPQRPEPMPIGVCAADLAVSADPRESQAGLHMIDKLLAIYRKELLRLDCRSPSDRRNIKTLTEQLAGDDADDYFDPLSPEQVAQAKMAINEFSRLLAMPRHGGATEEYLR
ncbi:hypothetical protein ACLUWX_06855 [Bifidobacterium apri]|uniref:hypothetical protein n=1 Tax=Bifidobacterium apri TaxID=1769423 RepID=UPI003991982E